MIAKIIVHGEDRFDALMKMQRALGEFVSEIPPTRFVAIQVKMFFVRSLYHNLQIKHLGG
jgi:biotin carboxylase